ncbi:unnamed protein product [Cylindrotheca closterium]|uniref:Uncharacterized protein n=1 Tax=Cylindrotheca closterium TaxID=2856 RepID=A0AAD2PWM9_9STRA|nr:unnamed protein product [Cylindrotheca closterium]
MPLAMSSETADECEKKTVRAKKSNETNNKKNQRKIRFKEQVNIHSIHCIPEKEKGHIWYTAADYNEASKNGRILRKCISNNDQLYRQNQENLNAQGVFTEQQTMQMEIAVKASTTAVFEEQERQGKALFSGNKTSSEFSLDYEKIAEAYRKYSREAQEQAQLRAARHEKHLKDTDTKSVKHSSPSSSPRSLKKKTLTGHSPKPRKSRSLSPKATSRGVRKLIPKPSVFLFGPKGSSKLTPAA